MLESPGLSKIGALEHRPLALESLGLSKTGALEHRPGALESPGLSKTGSLEHRPGALESPGLSETGSLEPHPVWGFKNIKGRGVGVVGRELRLISLVIKTSLQTGRLKPPLII